MKKILFCFLLLSSFYANSISIIGSEIKSYGVSYKKVMLTKSYTNEDYFKSSYLAGYLGGIVDETYKSGEYCMPANINSMQAVMIVVDYATFNSSEDMTPGNELIVKALKDRFPCK